MVMAIVLGMIYGNSFYSRHSDRLAPGLKLTQQKMLRAGVALFGLNISFLQIAELGWPVLVLDITVIAGIMVVGLWLGRVLLGLDRTMSALIAIGAAVCGAAAVLAAKPVTKANTQQVAMAVATVVLFGTAGMFIYPLLFPLLTVDETGYGIYVGSTIHEVAQVVVAGMAVGESAAESGVVVKLIRVMLLAPTLIIMGLFRRDKHGDGHQLYIPWFVLAFVAISALNTWLPVNPALHHALVQIDLILLSMAMAALGVDTNLNKLRHLGHRPILLAGLLFLFLIGGGWLLNRWILPFAG